MVKLYFFKAFNIFAIFISRESYYNFDLENVQYTALLINSKLFEKLTETIKILQV